METKGANPQREDGHIDIANEIAEQLCRINLRPYESRTLWALWRKTWGWQKKADRISITQFQNLTGLKRRHQHHALKTLRERNIIIRNTDTYIVSYSFQKDYTKWRVLPKQVTVESVTHLSNTPLPKQVTEPLLKQVNTKDNKETIQKKEEDFFSYFLLKTKKAFKLTLASRELIRQRFNEGYTLAQLKQAVDNFVSDPWEGRAAHLDLIYCIGKQKGKPDALEHWLNYQPIPKVVKPY